MLADHKVVFNDELGTLHGITVKLYVDRQSVPKFCKARPESRIRATANRSCRCSPIVPVAKRDDSVRICGDHKIMLNRVLKSEVYPLPRFEELFTALAGEVHFTKVDLSYAYQQLVTEEESAMLVTISTHKGLVQIQLPSVCCHHHSTCSLPANYGEPETIL